MKIKKRISFSEIDAIIDKVTKDCFTDGVYSPVYYDLSFNMALMLAYAPNFKLNGADNDNLYDCIHTREACKILKRIKKNPQYREVETAVKDNIDFRKSMITSGGMSMSDLALSKLLDKVVEIVDKVKDTIDTETTNQFINAMLNIQDDLTMDNLVKSIKKNGFLKKKK